MLEEIQEQVRQIYAFKEARMEDSKNLIKTGEAQYRNTKIVLWLLNRLKTHQQQERDDFFAGLNQNLNDQF